MLSKFLAKQLGHPSGLLGKLVAAPVLNKRNSALNEAAFDRLALRPYDRVLEVGFGGGYLIGRMAAVVTQGFLAGADTSPDMVVYCQERYRPLVKAGKLELKCASAESLPYPSGHFTRVCTVNSIFYWENVPLALAEMRRVLEESGLLVMCFTCKRCLENREFTRHGVTLYEEIQVQQMMEVAGFHAIEMTHASDRHREFVCAAGTK